MQSMGNWDYSIIVEELAELYGAFFDKFYICTDGSYLLRLRKKGTANIVANAFKLYLTEKPPATLETPPQFAMIVRKWLENCKLKSVEQVNGDRIISLVFEGKNGTFSLVFELFAKGNMLLLNSENKIVDVLKREEFASRKLKPREQYAAPPAKKPIAELQVTELLPSGKTAAVISRAVNAPPFYIEEAIERTNASNDIEKLTNAEKVKIVAELMKIKMERKPIIYEENGTPVAFSFTELKRFKKKEKKAFETFSQALDYYYSNVQIEEKVEKNEDKIATRLEFQRKAVAEYREKEQENHKIAEYIYEKYALLDELLQTTAKLMQRKANDKEIGKKLAEIAEKNGEKIEAKIKNGKIELIVQTV